MINYQSVIQINMKELINSYIHTKNCLTKSVLPPNTFFFEQSKKKKKKKKKTRVLLLAYYCQFYHTIQFFLTAQLFRMLSLAMIFKI